MPALSDVAIPRRGPLAGAPVSTSRADAGRDTGTGGQVREAIRYAGLETYCRRVQAMETGKRDPEQNRQEEESKTTRTDLTGWVKALFVLLTKNTAPCRRLFFSRLRRFPRVYAISHLQLFPRNRDCCL